MDTELLEELIKAVTQGVLKSWKEFGPDVATTMRIKHGQYIIVVGVEFATQENDDD